MISFPFSSFCTSPYGFLFFFLQLRDRSLSGVDYSPLFGSVGCARFLLLSPISVHPLFSYVNFSFTTQVFLGNPSCFSWNMSPLKPSFGLVSDTVLSFGGTMRLLSWLYLVFYLPTPSFLLGSHVPSCRLCLVARIFPSPQWRAFLTPAPPEGDCLTKALPLVFLMSGVF